MKTVGLEVELKLNLPSSSEETNEAAGLTIGDAGRSLPVQRTGTRSWVVGEWKLKAIVLPCFSHAAGNAVRPDCPRRCRP